MLERFYSRMVKDFNFPTQKSSAVFKIKQKVHTQRIPCASRVSFYSALVLVGHTLNRQLSFEQTPD